VRKICKSESQYWDVGKRFGESGSQKAQSDPTTTQGEGLQFVKGKKPPRKRGFLCFSGKDRPCVKINVWDLGESLWDTKNHGSPPSGKDKKKKKQPM